MSYADPGAHRIVNDMTIRMPYISDDHRNAVETWPFITARSPIRLRRIVEQLGHQYRRETHFDFPPYAASSPGDQEVVLLPAARVAIAWGELIAGAIGIVNTETAPSLGWAYVHPYQRGNRLVDSAWPSIVARYPSISLERDPGNTPAGDALMARLGKLNSWSWGQ